MWAFVYCQDNSVAQVKVFNNSSDAVAYAREFITEFDPNIEMPDFEFGDVYRDDNVTIGLYQTS
jgi:hypothetical protein